MRPAELKTGDIFYYAQKIPIKNTIHIFKCRVLFVGKEHVYYDSWREEIGKWAFMPVTKNITFYSYPLCLISELKFDGHELIEEKSIKKLFLDEPEIILNVNRKDYYSYIEINDIIKFKSSEIAFIPTGPKGGIGKPFIINTSSLTTFRLIQQINIIQNITLIPSEQITVIRVGLEKGLPSYIIENKLT